MRFRCDHAGPLDREGRSRREVHGDQGAPVGHFRRETDHQDRVSCPGQETLRGGTEQQMPYHADSTRADDGEAGSSVSLHLLDCVGHRACDAVHRGGDGVLPLHRVDEFVEIERDGRFHSLLQVGRGITHQASQLVRHGGLLHVHDVQGGLQVPRQSCGAKHCVPRGLREVSGD